MKKIAILMAFFVFAGFQLLQAQTVQISGTVTSSEDGLSVPGVSVVVRGTTIGTITDFNGKYTIAAPVGATTLNFSFVGYKPQVVAIEGRTTIDVILEPDFFAVEELVVVGYGVQRKREVTGAIATVRGDDIAQLATPSFEGLLAGRAAGVQVTTQSGVIGDVPRIRIRGISSLSSGTYPLVVVDGVPIITGNIAFMDGANALGDINPADIESIEILKDGSATAIYGSRAANGVMLITTKRGQKGRFSMTYNTYVGVAQPSKVFDLLNAEESILINNEKRTNRGRTLNAFAEGAAGPAVDTDWQGAVLRSNAFQQDHNLSFSGATEQTNYYVSLGFTDQEGVTRPNEFNRYSIRANAEQKVKKWLAVGANFGLTQSTYMGLNTGENALSGNIFSAIRQLPNTPIYNAAHPTGYNIDFTAPGFVGRWNNATTIGDNLPNIVYVINNNTFKDVVSRTFASAHANANILPSLVLRTQLSVDNAATEGQLYWNPIHGDGEGVRGRVHSGFWNIFRWNFQNVLSFNESFAGVHNLGVTLVQEFQKERSNWFQAAGTDMASEFFRHNVISGTFGTQLATGSLVESGFISYAGRLNYNFDGKYFIQASLRRDGISAMPQANKYGIFPGASVGWTISRESFMQGLPFISELRLRASYAEVGNTAVGNYPFLGLYGPARYGDRLGIGFVQMGNPQLLWETSKKMDIGVDLMFLDGKYQFIFDYFVNDQDGLILAVPTPPSLGIPGNSYSANIGAIRNSGFEFSAEANIFRTRDFSLTIDGNLTLVRNEVLSLVDGADITGAYTIVREGESINSIFGFEYVGVNPANGNPIYRKQDEAGTLVQANLPTFTYVIYNPANPADVSVASSLSSITDRKVFGPSMPTYFGSVGINFRYRAFDMSALFRYSGGNYIMNRTRDDLNGHSFTNNGREILGRWQNIDNPGDGWTPRLWDGAGGFVNLTGQSSGRFVEKGDFIKFSNLVIGYTFPKALLDRIGISNLRIFAQGSELFMITDYTGIDPEMEFAGVDWNITPRQRTITFGLSLTM